MQSAGHAIAIVGVGAVLPDAPNVSTFWNNIKAGRYSISEVTPDRWDPALYYDPDPAAPDKTYSKIGGWVREHVWEPVKWKLAIPPCVVNAMDDGQKWAISCTREALVDYGYPERKLELDRTAVILGNAMAGEKHYFTSLRIYFPEFARELEHSASFAALPEDVRRKIEHETHEGMRRLVPNVTEDTMPGELANCIAGRVANTFNFHGPNFVTDAACASAMAAMTAAVEGLRQHDFDVALTGGIDRNMGAPSFVKFCKIGALSATGTRPYADGADGFVMGEGAAVFLLKRLEDAERDGDKIYALILGTGASSDGKGKGITAPNPIGQKYSIERGWQNAGVSPATAGLIEGHGTSTRVGDVVEVESLAHELNQAGAKPGSVALGSVKSNFGHLKSAAGAAGVLKTTLALHHKLLPPSIKCERPNPGFDFAHSPMYVNTELREWLVKDDTPRRAGVSAFGFGGTNFHIVMEEYIPGRSHGNGKHSVAVMNLPPGNGDGGASKSAGSEARVASAKVPLRGALVIGAANERELAERLQKIQQDAANGIAPAPARPSHADLTAAERLTIDYGDPNELADKSAKALKALAAGKPLGWKMLRAQGVFRGHGPAPKIAFLYTGQGSQYVNMMRGLREAEPIVAETFKEADRVLTPLLGKPLSDFIFVDSKDPQAVAKAEDDLRQTAITQPAVLATDQSLTKMFAAYGIEPDMTMGHSLGEYGALVAAGGLPFADALEAVSARGREMTRVSMADNGKMAAVFAPIDEIERILKAVDGYVVIANINSDRQAVIGGASAAVEKAMKLLEQANFHAVPLPVSHAFHTSIVSPASAPLRKMLERLRLQSPQRPIVANVDGEFYPTGSNVVPQMLDILAKQVAAPVQFVEGLRTLYAAGARVFVEVGPKKALHGFVEDVLGDHEDVLALFSNHPKLPDATAFNQALCGMYAAGLGAARADEVTAVTNESVAKKQDVKLVETTAPVRIAQIPVPAPVAASAAPFHPPTAVPVNGDRYAALGKLFAEVLDRGVEIYHGPNGVPRTEEPVVITGAALGLPGRQGIFDESNIARILRGDQFIDVIPTHLRRDMLEKNITRLVKSDNGGPTFETINNLNDVIKLAGRGGAFDLEKEFGVAGDRVAALDRTTMLAIGAGIDALRDAGIPLVMRYKTTSLGTQLPDRWGLPETLRDDTGVIFGSAFPGYDAYAGEMDRYYKDHARREAIAMLEAVRARAIEANGHGSVLRQEIDRRITDLQKEIDAHPYIFDRRFLFHALSMGHSQFAEYIGARGPNTQINAACATTTQACTLAEDWIRAGRCRRVIVISADDVTSDNMIGWFGAGFLASGAAATDEVVEEAATPFDRRRHGLIMGMGAASIVIETADGARERGLQPICEVLGTVTANSAFHGSRLDVTHIRGVMEKVVSEAEKRHGISRQEIAPKTVFVSHETYTPARGGSASAEVHALRHVFGAAADQIIVANTKGYTGHAMATGIEDVLAIKSLETGCVPPVPNFKEIDPELGTLNLSKGGIYPVEYALRLGAGFGSQISMTLLRWIKTKDATRPHATALGYQTRIVDTGAWDTWLRTISGNDKPELEVVQHTLRVVDKAGATRKPATKSEPAAVAKPEPVLAKAAAAAAGVSATTAAVTVAPLVVAAPVAKAVVAEPVPAPVPVVAPEPVKAVIATPTPAVVSAPPVVETKQVTPAPAPVATTPTTTTDDVKPRILALVAEKTGYPVDMLDLDLDLEADLGIDTVKQAEIFASIRETYGIQRDDKVRLRDFPTLAHVIKFAHERRANTVSAAPAVAAVAPPTSEPPKPEVKTEVAPTIAPPPAPAPAPTPVVAAAALQAPAATTDEVKERILALVVEKTGYPTDMLDLDLDLEADLGVDTVKQAELFAAIRGSYGIERDPNLKLRDFPTLAHVIKFVYDRRPDLAHATPPAPEAVPPHVEVAPPAPAISVVEAKSEPVVTAAPAAVAEPVAASAPTLLATDEVKERILALVVEKTGYPTDMLDLDLDLEADLGVDTVKQAELFAAIRGSYGIERDPNLKLRDFPTLAHVIKFVYDRRPDLKVLQTAPAAIATPPAPAAAIEAPAPAPPVVAETPTPPPVVAAHAPVTVTASVSPDAIKAKVLDIVAEKTGYPTDMLDLDLDLEADLGIDTVKQAEMFAAIRAAYNIPRDANLKLRDFPTLAHVIKFAQDRSAAVQTTAAPAPQPAAEAAQEATTPAPVAGHKPRPPLLSFDAVNTIPRRVPVPVLRPALDVCKPTGVTLGPGTRVIVVADESGVAATLAQALQSLGATVVNITSGATNDETIARLTEAIAAGAVQGIFWLPALDIEPALAQLDITTWHTLLQKRIKSLYATMRTLYEQIATKGTFFVSAVRLGGHHGYDEQGAIAPLGGAVVGFTKAYKRERPDVLVKAVDFERDVTHADIAQKLIAETLRDPGAVEIGYKNGLRWTIGLQEQPAADGQPGLMLDNNTVFVVTGAAGSIVSAITSDLAAASGGTFYLLDLVPHPDASSADLERFVADKDGLKRELFARIQARGERATPAMVERELAALERAQAAQSAIDAVHNAGGTVHYFSVDMRDANAVSAIINEVRARSGKIDVLLHAAGLERSRFLPDKDPKEFDLVFDVKADGFFNLLHAITDMPLGATVVFSSVAGRFGNGGQTDYSSANDLLCKITSSMRTTRPSTRGIAIDWTAWGGIGMATRGSIPKMMELAGIDMLPPEAGVPFIRRELVAGGTRGEVVVAKRLGIMTSEFDPTGGIDSELLAKNNIGPMIGRVVNAGIYNGVTIQTQLDPKQQPFLHDHQINGTPVLPGVMGVEAFAEAASLLCPGWHIAAIEDVNFLAPFKFYRNEPRVLTINAVIHAHADELIATCSLVGERQLPNKDTPQQTTHFTGRVRLTRHVPVIAHGTAPAKTDINVNKQAIYRLYFHGPAYQVLDCGFRDGDRAIGEWSKALPENHSPAMLSTLATPRLIELCFQTAGLWEMGVQDRFGLPRHIDSVSVLADPTAHISDLYAIVTPATDGHFDAEVIDSGGNVYVVLRGYQTTALPNALDQAALEPLRHAMTKALAVSV